MFLRFYCGFSRVDALLGVLANRLSFITLDEVPGTLAPSYRSLPPSAGAESCFIAAHCNYSMTVIVNVDIERTRDRFLKNQELSEVIRGLFLSPLNVRPMNVEHQSGAQSRLRGRFREAIVGTFRAVLSLPRTTYQTRSS